MSMQYPKEFMSISELNKMGLAKDFLKQLSRAKGAPVVKTMGGGKIYFRTSELDSFMDGITKKVGSKKFHR
jgi:hypothetical protein